MSIPGTCDHCDRPASGYLGRWTGGAPSVGEYIQTRDCDYHMGDPPGSIPGRCWTCGQGFKSDQTPARWQHTLIMRDGPIGVEQVWYANFHPGCLDFADLPRSWQGPRDCGHCEHPIGYMEDYNSHHQPRFNRTLYSHRNCPSEDS